MPTRTCAGKAFNILDTLWVGTATETIPVDDANFRSLFGNSYIHSVAYQFKVSTNVVRCFWNDAQVYQWLA